ncbi:hypothetical protein Droror1_Dr00016320 [Drosera rotundifolia]
MENQSRGQCSENESLAEYMKNKIEELGRCPRGFSDNRSRALQKAYTSVCGCKVPIHTLKDFSQIKGIGKWIVGLMKGFFDNDSAEIVHDNSLEKGKKTGRAKQYVPLKNSVSYALLITLYRCIGTGIEFMRKQELIDAAEASGLSRVPIRPEVGKGKQPRFESSPRDWYSGWSCMKTLIAKGLVVKSGCPAKYMLTDEGRKAAHDCLLRSNMVDVAQEFASGVGSLTMSRGESMRCVADTVQEDRPSSVVLSNHICVNNIPPECLDRFTRMGFSKEHTLRAFAEVAGSLVDQDVSSFWPAVLCYLQEDQVYKECPSQPLPKKGSCGKSTRSSSIIGEYKEPTCASRTAEEPPRHQGETGSSCSFLPKVHALRLPPLKHWEKFKDTYEVIFILDNREHFISHGSKSSKIVDEICKQFNIKIEVRRLPLGDGVWIARHKQIFLDYILDFVVERKKVDDLLCSIRDNRYKNQKLRLLRSGLKKLIYVVEGDPNASEAAESIKTACLTTEILEEFDVLKTSSLGDTLKTYGYLTRAIKQLYESQFALDEFENTDLCPTFDEFIRRCGHLDKMTAGDVYATQLMQVPEVTEDIAVAVLDLYPTLVALVHAYSLLDGNNLAQEEMLKQQNESVISAAASRKIFQLVWGSC